MYKRDYSHNHTRHQPPSGKTPKSRHLRKWLRWIIVLLVLLMLTSVLHFLLPAYFMKSYVEPDGAMAAQVQIARTGLPGIMSIEVITYDNAGNQAEVINCYAMQDGQLALQGDNVTFASWLSILGLHSGLKLIGLEGCYNTPIQLERKNQSEVFVTNGGHGPLFKFAQQNQWLSIVVGVDYSKPFAILVGSKTETYYVFNSSNGLVKKP